MKLNAMPEEPSHRDRLFLFALWALLVMWLRWWRGDLYDDPLTYACISRDMVENRCN